MAMAAVMFIGALASAIYVELDRRYGKKHRWIGGYYATHPDASDAGK